MLRKWNMLHIEDNLDTKHLKTWNVLNNETVDTVR